MQHSIFGMYSSIQNGLSVCRRSILHPKNLLCLDILRVLYKEGYINGFRICVNNPNMLEIFLKYNNGKPVIRSIQPCSRPGRRLYTSLKTLWKVNTCLPSMVISTSIGVLSDKECRKYNQGGEILCILF